ncbi:autotransporter assembly complex protein TamA [Pseudomonas stutzeri]|nr:autotransporter assembly complex protein TamA [Stutzerimonas stutzeri]
MTKRTLSPWIGPLLAFVLADTAAAAALEVRLSPARKALRENIEAHVGELGERDARQLRRFARHAEREAARALQALGYYRPSIASEVLEDGDEPVLRLTIAQGEPVRLRLVEIRVEGEAAQLARFRVPRSDKLVAGAVLDHGAYEDAKRLIRNRALRFGFFDGAFVEQSLTVDPEAGLADIRLVYASGPRYALGAVQFEGETPLADDLLARMVPFRPGTPYDSDLIGELNRALVSSNYFEDVRVDAAPENASAQRAIPVQVRLQARKPRTLAAGVGYSTDVGPRLRGTWTRHWRGEQGHRLGADFEFSAPRQNLGTWYEIPLDPPLTDSLRFTTGYQREDLVDTESERLTLGVQWQHLPERDWQRILSLRWEQERFRVGEDEGRSSLLLPGIGFARTVSDHKVDPSRGWRLQADLTGAQRSLLSDVDLLHVNLQARGLTTLEGGHRLLGRVQLGGIASNDFSAVPPSLRFFAGGDQSVRGYDYQTLSPRDGSGKRVGGRYLAVASAEYQYPIAERWRLATFVDHGNAIDGLSDPLKTGVGIGVRWVSPVGPLRLDLARALDRDEGSGFRIHFSMGPEL